MAYSLPIHFLVKKDNPCISLAEGESKCDELLARRVGMPYPG
jgi:hypothetical protein